MCDCPSNPPAASTSSFVTAASRGSSAIHVRRNGFCFPLGGLARACQSRVYGGHQFAAALRHGTTRLRTHADIDRQIGLAGIRGTLAARAACAHELDIDVVAFAGARYDPLDPEVRQGLRAAIALGAEWLGAVPACYAKPRNSIDALFDLAVELDVGVDVHLDEHLDPDRSLSGHFAAAVLARGLVGKVTIICLPTTNLYLQDRDSGDPERAGPQRRGLAPLRELVRAGVPLRFASDDVRDAFFPYGSADLLEVAQLIVVAGHVEDPSILLRGLCDGRDTMREDDEANFALVRGTSLLDTIAERPRERIVVRSGFGTSTAR
jgi:cytosine deaminase